MGKALLVWRLVVKDIRHRPAQALLLLLVIAAGATTLTLGLALRGATDDPFARTQAATNGPDVVATLLPAGGKAHGAPADPSRLIPLESASGVSASSGPFPVTWAALQRGTSTVGAEVEGRDTGTAAVAQPKLVDGSWIKSRGVVLDAGFADALGVHVGDRIALGGENVEVAGIAVTAAVPDYPQVCAFSCVLTMGHYNPGLVWATESDVRQIAHASNSSPVAYFLNLKLSTPADATSFARTLNDSRPTGTGVLFGYTSQYIQSADTRVLANVQLFLFTGSSLLALLALASVAVLVGGRMAEQTRRVGLIKAIGGTPQLVAAVLLCENMAVGVVAAALGLVVGRFAAPSINGAGAGLLGAPSAPPVDASTIVAVIVMALTVAVAATFVPAVRAARQSTADALDDAARMPKRRDAVIRFSAHMPASLLLGFRLAVRRPRRLLLNLFSVTVTVSGLAAMLIMRATEANPVFLAPSDPLRARLSEVTVILSIVLFVFAAVNAVFIAMATVLEARQVSALSRALGATAQQVITGLCAAQMIPALVGSLLGIPGGIAIYYLFTPHGGTTTMPSPLWFVLIVLATPAAIGLLTAVPTRIGARQPVAQVLKAAT